MRETFRLKIGAKRQVTVPQRMLTLLHLSEGDELQIDVANNQIQVARALKALPTDLFTPEVLETLSKREAEMRGTSVELTTSSELREKRHKAKAAQSAD